MSYFKYFILIIFLLIVGYSFTQNSMIGDGFGGRKWYSPTNYSVGSYAAYSICYDDCYTTSENQLFGWGSNFRNTLGLGSTVTDTIYPTPIPFMDDVQYFSAGYVMGAIKRDSTGWAWGQSVMTNTGILGFPIQVISDAKFLDAGSSSISFVKYDGTVWHIGDNSYGNFGNGGISGPPFAISPVQTLNINNAVRTASNRFNTIFLLEDSTVWSVGSNLRGGLGVFTNTTYTSIQIPTLSNIIDIKSDVSSTIALDSAGNVYAWGEVKPNWGTYIYTPQLVTGLSDIVAISACDDGYHYLALDENKNCYAWGDNYNSQCGFNSTFNPTISNPQLVATDVIDIMAGEIFSYIVKSDGTLWMTGEGYTTLNIYPVMEVDSFTLIDPNQVPEACRIIGNGLLCDSIFIEDIILYSDSIYFPNVFTPNGDNSNDNFYFPNWGVEQLRCEIYNRWGTLIYQWNGIDGFWDGRTSSGEKCSDGVYYYIVYYKKLASENWEKHTGYVSLLR